MGTGGIRERVSLFVLVQLYIVFDNSSARRHHLQHTAAKAPPCRSSPTTRRTPTRRSTGPRTSCGSCSTATASELNIAHECIDRHVDGDRDRGASSRTPTAATSCSRFADIARESSRFAHWLAAQGVAAGRPRRGHARAVARLLRRDVRRDEAAAPSPCRCSRCSGRTASACACTTARRRCWSPTPRRPRSREGIAGHARRRGGRRVPGARSAAYPAAFAPATRGDDLAIYQYTSGTTRELPEAVKHTHRSIVTLMLAALYGTGLRPGDRFFCPSSPAWGHGLWHGTLAPLALGLTIGAYCRQVRRRAAAEGAARSPLHQPVGRRHALPDDAQLRRGRRTTVLRSRSSPSPASRSTARPPRSSSRRSAIPVCSMYGTTEIGVILVNYPGAADFVVKPGSLGKPVPGGRVEVQDADGQPVPARRDRRAQGLAPRRLDRRPRTWAASTRTATSITAAAPTTSSSPPAGR